MNLPEATYTDHRVSGITLNQVKTFEINQRWNDFFIISNQLMQRIVDCGRVRIASRKKYSTRYKLINLLKNKCMIYHLLYAHNFANYKLVTKSR